MKKMYSAVLLLTLGGSLLISTLAQADTILDYAVKGKKADPAFNQSIVIKDDQIMVKAAGGNRDIDLFYSRAAENVVVVDHRKRTLMTVDEKEVARINRQVKDVKPLLQGVAAQVAKLSPEQRQNWQELLGDSISLDTIAKASEPLQTTSLQPTKQTKKVAGFSCKMTRLIQGETPMADICLANPATLKISAKDEATLRALFGLYEKIAAKSLEMTRQLGLSLPTMAMSELPGIPIEIRDLSRDEKGGLTLSHVKTATVSPEVMKVPGGYKSVPLALWP